MDNAPIEASKKKKKILIVEDDEFLRDMMVHRLIETGYEVAIAKDGEEGLARAADMPDLILLDLVLPGFSGFELIAKLRQSDTMKGIPFMVLSNSAEEQNRKQGAELGAVGYLVKAQSTPTDIVENVDSFFAVHRLA